MLLDIRVLGDAILRERTEPVAQVTPELKELAANMLETMYAAEGIGLAAPQVGRRERVFVMDADGTPFVMINPVILEREGLERGEEGCLSMPELFGDVDRATRVLVRALDEDGEEYTLEAHDLAARCVQHEIDHLDGKLFIDYLSLIKRTLLARKWEREADKYPGSIRRIDPLEPRKRSRRSRVVADGSEHRAEQAPEHEEL